MTSIQYSELVDFLNSDANAHGLDHVATHGFLCATVVGPTLDGWQSVLFDGELDGLPDGVLDALTVWQKDIENELKTNERIELPIDEDESLSIDSPLGDWSVGFVDAMYANEHSDWFDADEDVATLTLPMVVFSGIEEEDADLTALRADEALLEQMVLSIEKNLSELYLLFHTPD